MKYQYRENEYDHLINKLLIDKRQLSSINGLYCKEDSVLKSKEMSTP